MRSIASTDNVTLDDDAVYRLIHNATARKRFNFLQVAYDRLRSPLSQTANCGTCGNKTKPATSAVSYSAIRSSIGSLNTRELGEIRNLLGARRVKVDFKRDGQARTINF